MVTTDLLKKVRKIEIKSRGLSNHVFAGEYHSAFKGRGIAFTEVREYFPGDDIRSIDWNVTARFNHPYVKVFEEERELTVMLLVDVSGSKEFGTQTQLKQDIMTEISAVLSFSAISNKDKVGVIFFSDKIEKFIPPKKGKSHILRIIRELINFKPENRKTNISGALSFFINVVKKKCTAFIISDFIDKNSFEDAIKISNKKHDIVAIRIFDERETIMPDVGMVRFLDSETGEEKWINTSDADTRQQYNIFWKKKDKELRDIFTKSGVDAVSIKTNEDYIVPLVNLFKSREARY
ncbi:MAG: DUF58 domain-containing protein [Bacteroidota bacterium]|nr:DUF58 domain-containing protein [Bacteroidota bacterium]